MTKSFCSSLAMCLGMLSFTQTTPGGLTAYFHGANLGGNPMPNLLVPIGNSTLKVSPPNTDLWEVRQKLSRGELSNELILLSGDPETATEHIILGNWQNHADGQIGSPSVGKSFADFLLKERPDWLSGPIDAIGYSRGGGVIYDFAKTLGAYNIGFEGLHFIDNHPVNGVEPQPYGPISWGDSVPTHLDNVDFAINYFQRNDTGIPGKTVAGAENLEITGSGLDHGGAYSYFHGTVDVESNRVAPGNRRVNQSWYDGDRGPRNELGFQYSHLGAKIQDRPAAGIHPALGGTGQVAPLDLIVSEGAWPWVGLTNESRKLLSGADDVVPLELVFSDPDSDVNVTVLIDSGRDPRDATPASSQLLPATASKTAYRFDVTFPTDGPREGYLHVKLDDGQHVKYTSAAFSRNPDIAGDFDQNGSLDVADIDLLTSAIRASSTSSAYDLNHSGIVNFDDLSAMVQGVLKTWFGDSNLDREFNSSDLVNVFQTGEYEDAASVNSTWSDGDWTGDGDFNSSDFVLAFQGGGYEVGPRVAVTAVPEASGLAFLVVEVLCLAIVSARRLQRKAE